MINELFILANLVTLMGTTFLIRNVLKNRKISNGYSPLGSLLTMIAVSLFTVAFYLQDNFLSVIFAIPTVVFWFIVTLIVLPKKLREVFG